MKKRENNNASTIYDYINNRGLVNEGYVNEGYFRDDIIRQPSEVKSLTPSERFALRLEAKARREHDANISKKELPSDAGEQL